MKTWDMFVMFKIVSNFNAKVSVNQPLVLTSLNLLWYKKIYTPLNSNQIVTVQMIAGIMVASKFVEKQLV